MANGGRKNAADKMRMENADGKNVDEKNEDGKLRMTING